MTASTYALSRKARAYAKAEATYGTGLIYTGDDVTPHSSGFGLTHSRQET